MLGVKIKCPGDTWETIPHTASLAKVTIKTWQGAGGGGGTPLILGLGRQRQSQADL